MNMAYEQIKENANFQDIVNILKIPNNKLSLRIKYEYVQGKYNFSGSYKMLDRFFTSEIKAFDNSILVPNDLHLFATVKGAKEELTEPIEDVKGGFMSLEELKESAKEFDTIEEEIKHYALLITRKNLQNHIVSNEKLQTELLRLFSSYFKAPKND